MQLRRHLFSILLCFPKICPGEVVDPYSKEAWLAAHNLYRRRHGVPPVQWSAPVAQGAQSWALQLQGTLRHSNSYLLPSPVGPAGENLAQGYPSAAAVCQAWYAESACCNTLPGCSSGSCITGHFTAMIWKGVTHIGCAVGPRKTAVCRYWSGPRLSTATANMQGAYVDNVPALLPNITTQRLASWPEL
jgi:hypothetical protein